MYDNGSITEQSTKKSQEAAEAAEFRHLTQKLNEDRIARKAREEGQNQLLMDIQAAADREAVYNNAPTSQSEFASYAREGIEPPGLIDTVRSRLAGLFNKAPAPAPYQERASMQEQELINELNKQAQEADRTAQGYK